MEQGPKLKEIGIFAQLALTTDHEGELHWAHGSGSSIVVLKERQDGSSTSGPRSWAEPRKRRTPTLPISASSSVTKECMPMLRIAASMGGSH